MMTTCLPGLKLKLKLKLKLIIKLKGNKGSGEPASVRCV